MTEIHVKNNSSDVTLDSWTLIDDISQDEDQNSVKSTSSSVEIIDMEPELDENREQKQEKEEESESGQREGFLAFDEFFQEKLLDYDYEHVEKLQKNKKKSKGKKGKYKAPNLGISVFITIILALTAFATLCSTLSQTANVTTEKEPELMIPVNKVVSPKTPKPSDTLLNEINKSLKEMEKIQNIKVLEEIENKFKNETHQQCPKNMAPRFRIISPRTPPETLKSKIPKSDSYKKQYKVNATNKSTWMVLKEFLLDTNFHAFVSLIMTNIYLFTLLIDIAKKPLNKNSAKQFRQKFLEELEKCKSSEECRQYLFKELPFWNSDISEKTSKNRTVQKSTNTSKTKITTAKRTNTVTILNETKKADSVLFRSCPFLAQMCSKPTIQPINEESGKSECQRRFDELDLYQKKFEELRETQKNRIKLLKQKFKNEVSHIRDTEKQAEARAEKINKTSQRFIKKLKYNRERYLVELKKVKELRQNVADAKKKDNLKDVATGSYEVALPSVYDYGEKFKVIKEKFEKEGNQLPKQWKF